MLLTWWQLAECRKAPDRSIFFPENNGNQVTFRQATAYCDRCLVRAECLAEAVDDATLHGIWGGDHLPVSGTGSRTER